ncbi:hypothetical protein ACEPAG_5778 [Sanghuangporus baumii]
MHSHHSGERHCGNENAIGAVIKDDMYGDDLAVWGIHLALDVTGRDTFCFRLTSILHPRISSIIQTALHTGATGTGKSGTSCELPGIILSSMPGQIDKDNSITPLTAKQILRASRMHSEAPWRLDGRELHLVRCIGTIVDMDLRESYRLLKLEDGTARQLNVHVHKKENDFWDTFTTILSERKIKNNKYACVVGWINGNRGYRNSIRAKFVLPVDDPHQIFFHLFECVKAVQDCEVLETKWKEQFEDSSLEASVEPNDIVGEKDEDEVRQQQHLEEPPTNVFDESTEEEPDSADEEEPPEDSSDDEPNGVNNGDSSSPRDDEPEPNETVQLETEITIVKVEADAQLALPHDEPKPSGPSQEVQDVSTTLESLTLTAEITSTRKNAEPNNDSQPEANSNHVAQPNMDPLSGLSNIHRALLLHIQQHREETWMEGEEWTGLHMSELVGFLKRCKKGMKHSEISAIFDYLCDGGHIISTIDDNHFDIS